MSKLPQINVGKRAVIAGRTGTGKSTLGKWILNRSPGHWIILNPKWTSAYGTLKDSVTIEGIDLNKIEKAFVKHKYTIVNPHPEQSNPETMDAFIEYMHLNFTGFGIVADELYTLHKNGQAGQGLLGLLTRGRELKHSFLGLTQRPVFVSKFIFSESDYIGALDLTLSLDQKTMYENTGREEFRQGLNGHEWLWLDIGAKSLRKFQAVPIN